MDKQEYLEIVGDIRHAYDRKEYDKVLMYAEELELRKVSDSRVLEMIADAYDAEGDIESAKELLEKAYEKTPMGRKLAYKLSEIAIRQNDLDTAVSYYEDFRKMAPNDNDRILLKYKIGKAGGVAKKDLAKALSAYCSREIDEKWMAELAALYADLGETEKCNEVCDNIILWFADGIYVKQALELKQQNGGLTESQQNKLIQLEEAMKAEQARPVPAAEEPEQERELRPGSMEPQTLTVDDLDSILEEYITIEDATSPPPKIATADLSEAMSGKQPPVKEEKLPDPDTEVIPIREIRNADRPEAEVSAEIAEARSAAKTAAEREAAAARTNRAVEDILGNDIVLEEMELKTAPVHEEVQEAIAENMDQPEPEEVPDVLTVPEAKAEPEEAPEAESAPKEAGEAEPLFAAAEAGGKPFSNIEALQIARTAPPRDEASFWKMPEELSVGEEPAQEEYEEPVYGSHRWFEQPEQPEPEFEEPVFGAHRFVPQSEPEEEEYAENVEIEQVEPEPIVIEAAEEEDFFEPHMSAMRTTSSGAELAGLYASAKNAEKNARISDQAALVRKPALGIKKVLPPEMFADPIKEPEYYEAPAAFGNYETPGEPVQETAASQEADYTEFEVFEAAEPEVKEEEPKGPDLFPGFGEELIREPEPEAEPEFDSIAGSIEDLAVAQPEPEPVRRTPKKKVSKKDRAFEKAVKAFDREHASEDAFASETEFIPAAEVVDIIKTEKNQEAEVESAESDLLDELFAEDDFEDVLPEDFEEKMLEFDLAQQKEAEEQEALAKTIEDLKKRILELEQAQSGAAAKASAPEAAEEEAGAEKAEAAAGAEDAEETAPEPEAEEFVPSEDFLAKIAEEADEKSLPEEAAAEEAAETAAETEEEAAPEPAAERFTPSEDFLAKIAEEAKEPEAEEEPAAERFIPSEDFLAKIAEEADEKSLPEEAEAEEAAETADETEEEAAPEPAPFLFSVMPHESIEEVVPDIIAERRKEAEVPVAAAAAEPELQPQPEIQRSPEPEPERKPELTEDVFSDEAFEQELLAFEEDQKESGETEFEKVVQELELSSRIEDFWEEEPEEPQVEEVPVVEITASIPPVKEPEEFSFPIFGAEEPEESVYPEEETEVIPEPEAPEAEMPEAEVPEEPFEEALPEESFAEEAAEENFEAGFPEEPVFEKPADSGPDLMGFFRKEARREEPEEEELSDFEKAMRAFEQSEQEVPEEEFTPNELDEAMEAFMDEKAEPWAEPEFGMPDFEESAFEKPEYLGNDFDQTEEEPEEIPAPEEPGLSLEEVLEEEMSGFEKALLAFENSEAERRAAEAAAQAAQQQMLPDEEPRYVPASAFPEEEPEEPQYEPAPAFPEEPQYEPAPAFPEDEPEYEPEPAFPEDEPEDISAAPERGTGKRYRIPADMQDELSEFLLIDGMEEKICAAIDSIVTQKRNGDPTGGNLIVTGDAKSGKTYLTISLIKAVGKEIGNSTGRVAKVQAEALNGKDMRKVFTKITGSDLIIENAGYLSDETIERLIKAMETIQTSSMVVLEGNELGVENILTKYPQLERLFRTRLDLAELSLSQWAELACDYAESRGYQVGDMALLALHAKIDEMNLPTTRLVVEDIHGIIDKAIDKSNRKSSGRRSKKKGRDGVQELVETDFM